MPRIESETRRKTCPRCDTSASMEAVYCSACGSALPTTQKEDPNETLPPVSKLGYSPATLGLCFGLPLLVLFMGYFFLFLPGRSSHSSSSNILATDPKILNIHPKNKKPANIQAYQTKISGIIHEISTALDGFNEQNRIAAADPNIIYDREWKIKQALWVAGLKAEAEEIYKISNVPQSAKPLHATMRRLASVLLSVCSNYVRGVDKQDLKSLNKVSSILSMIPDITGRAVEQIQELQEKYR